MLSAIGISRTSVHYGARTLIGAGIVIAYLVALAWAMDNVSYDVWGAMVIGPVLVVVSLPILSRAARADPKVGRLLYLAFAAKMLGTLLRYAVTFEVYGGRADAGGYHGSGSRLATAFWDGNWDRVVQREVPDLVGTEFMRLVTGLIYIVTNPTKLGGFFVFSWLGFWGLFCFYRAFRIAFPAGEQRRYALAVFFLPTLLYWPSSIGKESWMLLTLGVAAYGAALILTYRPHGYVVLFLGLAGTAAVRPHVTLLVFVALFVAHLLRRRSWRESRLGLLGRLAGVAVLLVLGLLVISSTADFFKVENIDTAAVGQVLDRAANQSSQGGSEFEASRLTSPVNFPYATASVLFRPFPWEAGNTQALAAAMEGVLLMVLFLFALPRLARIPGHVMSTPYVAFVLVYSAMFVLAFSTFGNFGLLTRQRTQVLPFVLVLIAIPLRERIRDPAPELRHAAPRPRAGAGAT